MSARDEDRVGYLAGETDASLGALDPAAQAELDQLRALLADEAVWAEPSADLEAKVLRAVQDAAAGTGRSGPAPAAPLPPPVVTPPPPTVTPPPAAPNGVGPDASSTLAPLRRRSGGTGRRGWMLAAVGLAAAIALVAGAAFLATREPTGADTFALTLEPTELAPQARADVTMTRTGSGWRIELDGSGLPRLEAGRFYEAWLRNADGVLVSIGTFNEPVKVTLWAGVSPRDFPTVTVTQEEADGNPASSGQRVLIGEVDLDG